MILSDFLKELLTILIAASPVSELRGAIPTAMFVWHFSVWKAYLLAVFGNFLPVIPLLLFWRHLSEWLFRKSYWCNRLFAWLFERTRRNHSHRFEIWEEIALFIFVAIPLPLTGAWTGTVAAFIFDIPFWKAVLMILLGIIVAGAIVSFLSAAGLSLI
ncbi:small multi-drug export protein [Candidatus Wolfebacteria bacterium]|nr:small multi-drug export protein [Candidatus Wolfebacteria bacterium]